jgi:hypothetical protein
MIDGEGDDHIRTNLWRDRDGAEGARLNRP